MATDLVTVILFEFAISILGLFVISIPIYKKYKDRKSKVTLFVFLGATLHLLAGIVSGVGRVLRYTNLWEIQPGIKLEFLTFTVALIAWGDAFFLAFTLEVFQGGINQRKNRILLAIFVIVVILFNVYDFATGLFIIDLPLQVWVFLILIACFSSIYLTIIAWMASKKFDSPVDRLCTKFIAIGSLIIMISFVFFSVESVLTYSMGGDTQYSIYFFLGWWLLVLAIFILSTGYIQPKWLKKLIKSQ